MIADIYRDVERHLNATLIARSAEETKHGTDESSDYGRHRRDRRLHGTPATRETARGAGARPSARRAIGATAEAWRRSRVRGLPRFRLGARGVERSAARLLLLSDQ